MAVICVISPTMQWKDGTQVCCQLIQTYLYSLTPSIKVQVQVTMAKALSAFAMVTCSLAGQSPPKSKLKYRKLDEKVQRSHNTHQNGAIETEQLLSTIEHCLNAIK